ncbi:SDR family NAD(P)-dependent oxidoreductase, partial [Variovorax sp. CT11-76]
MTKSLSGKAALVTGGSRGIGAAIVRRLANDGAAVAFTYASSDAASTACRTACASARSARRPPLRSRWPRAARRRIAPRNRPA